MHERWFWARVASAGRGLAVIALVVLFFCVILFAVIVTSGSHVPFYEP